MHKQAKGEEERGIHTFMVSVLLTQHTQGLMLGGVVPHELQLRVDLTPPLERQTGGPRRQTGHSMALRDAHPCMHVIPAVLAVHRPLALGTVEGGRLQADITLVRCHIDILVVVVRKVWARRG
jgi:hypothetical protein